MIIFSLSLSYFPVLTFENHAVINVFLFTGRINNCIRGSDHWTRKNLLGNNYEWRLNENWWLEVDSHEVGRTGLLYIRGTCMPTFPLRKLISWWKIVTYFSSKGGWGVSQGGAREELSMNGDEHKITRIPLWVRPTSTFSVNIWSCPSTHKV